MKDNLVEIPYRRDTPRFYKKHWEITIEHIILSETELQDSEREVFQEWIQHLRDRKKRSIACYENIAIRDIMDVAEVSDDLTTAELLWWMEKYPDGFVKFHAWTMYQEEQDFMKCKG